MSEGGPAFGSVSFALQVSATQYAGNASTATAYPIAFPIVSMDHVAVTVQPAGATPLVLGPGQFTVHDRGAGLYDVTTATAWPATALVTVFRSIPFDQPFEFPEGSIFRTSEVERALDRVVMQMHQLWRLYTGGAGGTILPGAGTTVRSLAVWSDAAAQASVTPAYHGQLGTRLADDTLWIAQSTSAGDWQAYAVPQSLDVWSPDAVFRRNEVVLGGLTDQYVATVPSPFLLAAVRVSCAYNAGISLSFGLTIGQDALTFADYVWSYYASQDSILIPYASLGSLLPTPTLPAGARIDLSTEISGAYGQQMRGLQFDFIGRWVS